ncbi:hypothetical protein EP1X_00095 [Thermococcus sp. EP1]|uniref:carbohydrate kinase family protein n=1 Tax=Thermococcus sp. EP1 TaxID=1591054 RepID=UPI0006DB1FE6|nr:sugar kinase [Thermococcus sp. EP1]KPU63645.1 hypothetical protein EP1X_00095 [Thermococcus sp. EP1]
MIDILTLGEALVDLKLINSQISMHAGGSVLNFSYYAEQTGAKVKFVGTIGNDFLADHIESELKYLNSNIKPFRIGQNTTLVLIKEAGKDFIIYRGADRFLTYNIIERNWKKAEIVHTSAFALSLKPASAAILRALKKAKDEGVLISIDPNYRKEIWKKWNAKKENLLQALAMADYVKPSFEDAKELFGIETPEEALKAFKNAGAKNIILSMGERGVIALTEDNEIIKVPAKKANIVDLTGAGDSLFGTVIANIAKGYSLNEAIQEGINVATQVIKNPGNLVRITQ